MTAGNVGLIAVSLVSGCSLSDGPKVDVVESESSPASGATAMSSTGSGGQGSAGASGSGGSAQGEELAVAAGMTGASGTQETDSEEVGGSEVAVLADGGSAQSQQNCVPEEPAPVDAGMPCTDDRNEDEPDTPCSQWVEWGTCDEEWMIERHVCDRSCGRCTETEVGCADTLNEDDPSIPCSQWVEWGTCEEEWMIERHVCDISCGRCSEGDAPPPEPKPAPVNTCSEEPEPEEEESTPVMNEGPKLPPLEGGQPGFTTRYWDCCKPHCGWPGNSGRPISSCDQGNGNMGGNFDAPSACEGGPAHMCWNFVPQSNGDNIAYAFAAHNGVGCGTCFQLQFTGESHNPNEQTGQHDLGSQSLAGKQMIVQVINTGGIEPGQFDLLVPGGGVGDFDACSSQWGSSDLGERYGGFFLACQKEHNFEYEPSRQCARDWCDRVLGDKGDLHAGCMWFADWFGLADNPTMTYAEVPCPPEISAISGF